MAQTDSTSWKMPDLPPEEVETLLDEQGRSYHRFGPEGFYWYCEAASARGTYAWPDLLWQRGPLTAA